MTRIALTSMPKVALVLASAISAPVSAMADIRVLCIDGTTRPLFIDDPEQELECFGEVSEPWWIAEDPADPVEDALLQQANKAFKHDWGAGFKFAQAVVIQ